MLLRKVSAAFTSIGNRIVMSKTLFCHFDIEADGIDVMQSNMISIGICFTDNKGIFLHRLIV